MVRGLEMDQDLEKTALDQYIVMELGMVRDQVMDLDLVMELGLDLVMVEGWDLKFMKSSLINDFKGLIAGDSPFLFEDGIGFCNGRGTGNGEGFCYGGGDGEGEGDGESSCEGMGDGSGTGIWKGSDYGYGFGSGNGSRFGSC
jgi:hypothetical protein